MIDLPEVVPEVRMQCKWDMETFAANYPADARSYSRVLSFMGDTILSRGTENTSLKAALDDLRRQFAVRESTKTSRSGSWTRP